jgi:hypothetical protein
LKSPVTEYGRVLQSRKETKSLQVEDRRWIRTLNFQSVDIDGNPNHPVNGGYFGLSQTHCVGSLLNHSRQNAKCVYDKKDFLRSRFLISTDNTAIIGCIFIKTTYDIQVHEQLLIDYEPSTAKSIENLLPFV